MNTVFENSPEKGLSQVSCTKYKNLNNLSHYHSDYELIFVNEGSARIYVEEQLLSVGENKAVFVHSNSIHHIHADEHTVITVLKADKDFLDKLFADTALVSPLIGTNTVIRPFLDSVYRELQQSDRHSNMMANCMTLQFFITLLRSAETVDRKADTSYRRSTREFYRELCTKISEEYSTVTFEATAKHLNLCEAHFSRVFHNIFGMTFTQYLNTVRIAAALEKIKQGRMSMTEISDSCGFNSIRNFNRVFKKYTGYSPKSIPADYVFLYKLQEGYGLDPTLNCTIVIDE